MKEKQPLTNHPEQGFENLEAYYDFLDKSGKQVLALVYNKPYEVNIGEVSVAGRVEEVSQERLRVWALINDSGGMQEVSIKDVAVEGLNLKIMQRDGKELEEWLWNMFVMPVKPKGPYSMSSVPIKHVAIDNFEDDPVAKEIWKLSSYLNNPKLKFVNKEGYLQGINKLMRLISDGEVNLEKNRESYFCTKEVARITGISETAIRNITKTREYRLFSVKKDLSGVRQFDSNDIAKIFAINYLREKNNCIEWIDVGIYVRRGISKQDEAYDSDEWKMAIKVGKKMGADLSRYVGSKDFLDE